MAATAEIGEGVGVKPREILRTKSFYLLWAMFVIGALAGLMVIGNVQNFAKSQNDGFLAYGFSLGNTNDFAVLGAAVCLPIFNGVGRIVWGQISDKIGRRKALVSMFVLQAIMMAVFFYTTANQYVFYIVTALIGFNFGGNFALFPAATADSFGAETLGLNYGFVFTAYGIGGIAGPILAGTVQDANMSFLYAFIPASLMCLAAGVIGGIYKDPRLEKKST